MGKALLELKAKVESLDKAREALLGLGAQPLGTFHQIDTYFKVSKGRLKLREVEGSKTSILIYYEREDLAEPKRSYVWLAEVSETENIKEILSHVLGIRVVVDKVRDVFTWKNVRIHLDQVEGLGTYIEFEKSTESRSDRIAEDRELLKRLMGLLCIKDHELVRLSYSDMLEGRTS
ncbi:MAG: class IV adenylate cyclase [Candidatus Bathyarchaeia archaeon]